MNAHKRVGVSFIWHMHQPYYKDPLANSFLLPWVRLHAVKDYLPMALLVERSPRVKATFNIAPVLIEQLNDYVTNATSDILLDLTVKKASALTHDERAQILSSFFKVNFKRFIEPHDRYTGLFIKKGLATTTAAALKRAARSFSDQDLLDLQVLFNLAWFHSITVENDASLREIISKKRDYSEEDKAYIVRMQKQAMAAIVPLYRKLQDAGRLEITATPFYHPILPLLCDTSVAATSSPGMALPARRFRHPEDADWHIRTALQFCEDEFGKRPAGIWPSEGSVSDDAIALLAKNGVRWFATDEDILFRSLTTYHKRYKGIQELDRRLVYQPYRMKTDAGSVTAIFRDKNMSNLISFNYASWDQTAAAGDLLGHLTRITDGMRRDGDTGLITIVMDGENAWEYYEDNGRTFFELVYEGLDRDDQEFSSTTVSEYLLEVPTQKSLSRIFPGSWINQNFEVWIGQEQDNLSWEYLDRVRRDLVRFTDEAKRQLIQPRKELFERAWRQFYIAEGSDWNWWYAGTARVGTDNPFDIVYRIHLKNVYKILKKPVPEFLNISIA